MRAIARRTSSASLAHRIEIRQHELLVDEPADLGGADDGPTPQELLAGSLASCTAITLEMYARRKGWDLGAVEVLCDYQAAERGARSDFTLVLRLSAALSDEQVQRLTKIATKCPVLRTLSGEVSISERIELVEPGSG
jgi:putative redox protein